VLEGMVSKFRGELNLAEGYRSQVKLNSGKGEARTYHVIDRRNIAHRGGVARTRLDLLTIGKGLANTITNEVIPEVC
jgi:hypothetical protein